MKLVSEEVESLKIIEEAKEDTQKEFFLEGIFMQANKKNRNGRIYPMSVMEPEVEKYKKEYVDSKRAFGELGHPCFVDENWEVLTPNGWKHFTDVKIGDAVIGMNDHGGMVTTTVFNKIEGKEPEDSYAYHIKGRMIDTTVTAPHRFFCKDRNDRIVIRTAEELYENSSHLRIIKSFTPVSRKDDVVEFDGRVLSTKVFCSIIGFWLAEGWTKGTRVYVSQNSGDVAEEYKALLQQNGIEYTVNYKTDRINTHEIISFKAPELSAFLQPLGNCYTKYVPDMIKSFGAESLKELLIWFAKGDGRTYHHKSTTNRSHRTLPFRDVFSVSKRLIDDLEFIAIKCGYSTAVKIKICMKDYKFADRMIKAEHKKPLYVLYVSETSGIHLDRRYVKIEKIKNPTGMAYCLTTGTSNFYVRQNGRVFLSGNCNPQINLDRVSHLITDIWRDGDYFHCRAKILDTPYGRIAKELIKEGCKLGVSSRALGSIVKKEDADYVQSDFHLVTAGDIVWEPSAQAAFPNGLMEGVEWEYDEKTDSYIQRDENSCEETKVDLEALAKLQTEEFKEFLKKLKK